MSRIIDLDAHEAAARAAQAETCTDGEWFFPGPHDPWWLIAGSCVTSAERPKGEHARVLLQANLNFESGAVLNHVAANSPPVALAMIERIRKLERALHEALNWWSAHDTGTDTDADFIRLRAVADAKVVLP